MSKKSDKNGIASAFGKKAFNEEVQVAMPTRTAMSIDHAFNNTPQIRPFATNATPDDHLSWFSLEQFSNDIREMIFGMATSLKESVVLIENLGGVTNLSEFSRSVASANADMERFTNEFLAIRAQHEGLNGIITDAEAHTKYNMIMENYISFQALFSGAMHHTMINFTEYSLMAKDAAIARLQNATPEKQTGDQHA